MTLLSLIACAAAMVMGAASATGYRNPVLHADYSDPDAIRVGSTFYLTSSSFNSAPGLPLLESRDMVHWQLVGHALPQLVPEAMFAQPQHGKGVWAPVLRYHDGKFWIFYPDPDQGIYVTTARQFRGPWSRPHLLLAGKGLIDPAPLWDDDGSAWLVHAWAGSRAGINNIVTLRRMAPDASRMLDEKGRVIIDGKDYPGYHTVEGPKLYKRHGWYYVFAPAGGVEYGWQSVFRARRIAGPYEAKIVMIQGDTTVNGPHQGAWVQTADGKDWFYHFQDQGAYGRIVHLQPMQWKDDWPVIGEDKENAGVGYPVAQHAMPVAAHVAQPATSDDFSAARLGLQWQWNANWSPAWYSLGARKGYLRLFSQYDAQEGLWHRSAILLQKLPAERFSATARVDLTGLAEDDRAGLVLYGDDYAWLGARRDKDGMHVILSTCLGAMGGCSEREVLDAPLSARQLTLRVHMEAGGHTRFAYSADGKSFTPIDVDFVAAPGRWVGARMGLFSAAGQAGSHGYLDVDDFQVREE